MKLLLTIFLFSGCARVLYAQDSTVKLNDITVTGYINPQPLFTATTSAAIIDSQQLKSFAGTSLVPVLNTAPGVRMEERSPGSYRLSIRGSLLRSPFGIRNVKVYMNGVPLTDAGGNTYLNALSLVALSGIEILKGPDGSIFGANSGGVVLLNTNNDVDGSERILGLSTGSYGLFNEQVHLKQKAGKHILNFSQSYIQSSGYRENSALRRLYIYLDDKWQYSASNYLSAFAFYSNLRYQTPGGLTASQYKEYPAAARFPTALLPGAKAQKAAVYNKMLFGGLTHHADLSSRARHVISLFGSTNAFKNPFITNYETRDEKTYGIRTYLNYDLLTGTAPDPVLEYTIGAEWQTTEADIRNYGNIGGERGSLQAADNITSRQYFIFSQLKYSPVERLVVEAAASLNKASYTFNDTLRSSFGIQVMPRLAISYKINEHFSLRGIISRGYSMPTTAEIRPPDNKIYQNLQPENGWNFEAGLRSRLWDRRLLLDVALYHYRLHNAIVRRQHTGGSEYFINAGGTRQTGVEAQATINIVRPRSSAFIRALSVTGSYTLNLFYFSNYSIGNDIFSGNRLTGVPRNVIVTGLNISFPGSLYLFAQHNYTDKIPLNDGNTKYADAYHLIQAKAGWKLKITAKGYLDIFAGADNILNEKYSLGNDLNAAGGRYFNAATPVNYFAGLTLSF